MTKETKVKGSMPKHIASLSNDLDEDISFIQTFMSKLKSTNHRLADVWYSWYSTSVIFVNIKWPQEYYKTICLFI